MAGDATKLSTPNPSVFSITKLKRLIREEALSEWKRKFIASETNTEYSGTPTLSLSIEFKGLTPATQNRGEPRSITTPLVHLRLGHGYFKAYFQRFKIPLPSYRCSCRQEPQTRTHLLLLCPTYEDARRLFFTSDPNKQWSTHTLLHTKDGIKRVLSFVRSTKVATRGWFTGEGDANPEDNEDETWTNLDMGLGRLNQDGHGDSEEEELARELARGPLDQHEEDEQVQGIAYLGRVEARVDTGNQ
jgi:hypothetical protein